MPGALLSSAGLFALVYGIATGGENGWTAPSTMGALAAATLLLAAFAVAESRHGSPLIPLGLLRRRNVAWSGVVGFVTFGMCGGATLLSLYMQDVLGYTALQTGLRFLAEGLAALVGGLLAARLIGRFGAVAVIAAAGILAAAGGFAGAVFLRGRRPEQAARDALKRPARLFFCQKPIAAMITGMTSGCWSSLFASVEPIE